MAESTKALANLICNFCFETIQGHESGIYKVFVMQNQDLNLLCMDQILLLFKDATLNYLNCAYASLIRKSDPYIQEKFDAMCKISGHSAICLLNIIAVFIMSTHASLNRSDLIIVSYNSYMKSVKSQLDAKRKSAVETLTKSVSHTCTGIDISTCDPNKPMFF